MEKQNYQYECPDHHYVELWVEWTEEWKNPGLGYGIKRIFHSDTFRLNPLAAFAMSNESQLRSLIRSSKEAEIKIKWKATCVMFVLEAKWKTTYVTLLRGSLIVYF